MIRQYVGPHWSEEGTSEKVPVNLLSLFVSVVGRNLIAKNPRVTLSTFDRGMKPAVSAMQQWANEEIGRMKLEQTLQRVVVDGLFSLGVCKVALASPAESAALAWGLGAGQPFAARVDLDDFVFDMHARSFEEVQYIGHRYRVPLDVVRDSKLYDKSRKELVPSRDEPFNVEGDERVKQLGQQYVSGAGTGDGEFEEMVDLWEIYLPRHKLVLTLADDSSSGPLPLGNDDEPLRVQRWVGPEAGPYHLLCYGVVPGNAMPKAPLQDLMDLHTAANQSYRKAFRAVERMKEITLVRGGADADGNRVMTANDGDILRTDDPQNLTQLVMGGQHLQHVLATATTFKDLFVYAAGNLDMVGGLSPQSKTLGQDQMLAQNASRAIADMQDRTVNLAAGVIGALVWYAWNHPLATHETNHSLRGLPHLSVKRSVSPQQRQKLPFEKLKIEVDPYSMRHRGPEERMAALDQLMTQIYIPLAPLMQQSGIVADWNAYLKLKGQYLDMPDLAEILTVQEPPEAPSGGSEPTTPKPAQTTRAYVRENRPSQTREASDRNLVSSLMGLDTGGASKNGQNGSPR